MEEVEEERWMNLKRGRDEGDKENGAQGVGID